MPTFLYVGREKHGRSPPHGRPAREHRVEMQKAESTHAYQEATHVSTATPNRSTRRASGAPADGRRPTRQRRTPRRTSPVPAGAAATATATTAAAATEEREIRSVHPDTVPPTVQAAAPVAPAAPVVQVSQVAQVAPVRMPPRVPEWTPGMSFPVEPVRQGPNWVAVPEWGTARSGEFAWARICRLTSYVLLILQAAALVYAATRPDVDSPAAPWRSTVLFLCISLIATAFAPPLLRRLYERRYGPALFNEAGSAVRWF